MASSLLFLLLLSLFTPTLAKNVSFDSASFSFSNLTLLGDSYLRNGVIGLTKETGVPSSSAGSVILNLPIQFFDPVTNTAASFSTKFSFSITNQNPGSFGDGLTFFISPSNSSLGATGGFLGVFNSTSSTDNETLIAVEFDTLLNEEFNDITDNHVGLDIGDPLSIKAVDLGSYGIDLKSGNSTTAWIDYSSKDNQLGIWLAYTNVKPDKPIFSINIDLSKNFAELMYVGFSASTEGSTELHMIRDWTFQTFGFPSINLSSSATPNSTNGSVGTIPNITINSSNVTSRKRFTLAMGILGPLALCLGFVLFMWVTIKKIIELTTKKEGFASEALKGPRKFTYKELSAATRGYHMTRIIGKGAFGTVFKAVMPGTGDTYAVKRAKQEHQCKSEFVSELSTIACLRHKNLVQLEGWCEEKGELLLVYEFMPHGSLDKVLYREPNQDLGSVFNWPQRYNVAIGLASALSYLHQECEQRVIHRDIKTSNILLDVNFNPRLGDFGLARLMDHNKSPVSTLTAGTMGYLAPEYLQCGKATDKTDVFSYGVVVLEVCCGRRPIDKEEGSKKTVNLVDWVWKLYSEDRLIEAADSRLHDEFDEGGMVRLLLVGLSCANPNCVERPNMRKVFQILSGEAEPIPVPKKKPLLVFCSSASLSMKEIVSDGEDTPPGLNPLTQIKID